MTESKQDTITVELPIAAHDEGYVKVDHVALATRERWREIAADPVGADTSPLTAHIAPAVVAWIERDEWKPLDVPEVGRTIKATKRNGKTEAFQTSEVKALRRVVHVYDSEGDHFAIPLTVERAEWERDYDIIAWEYADEPTQPTISAEQLSVMAQFIEDQCFCGSFGTGEEHARKVLAKAGLVVAGESQ